MDAAHSSKIFVRTCQTTQHHIQEDHNKTVKFHNLTEGPLFSQPYLLIYYKYSLASQKAIIKISDLVAK